MRNDRDGPAPGARAAERRYHGLDALRAGAMALGVVLHAAAPYLRHPLSGLVWSVDGPAAGGEGWPWLDGLFWWMHAWRVPLFFVMAGFFAAMLAERRGLRALLRHRRDRLLLPLLAACVVILPVCYFAFAWGWTTTGRATWSEVMRISFGPALRKDEVLGPAHLWFLVYLGLFTLLYAGLAALPGVGARLARPLPRGWGAWAAVGAGAVTAGLTSWAPAVALSFENNFVPRPAEFAYQGLYFAAGVVLYGARGGFDGLARRAGALAGLAAVGGGAGLGATLAYLGAHGGAAGGGTAERIALGAAWSAGAWLTILAALAAALRWLDRPRAWVRWLSDSAYWVYLTHVPVVAAVHVALNGSGWPAGLRFLTAAGVGFAVTLATYRGMVRYTFLGVGLHGPRRVPPG